MPFLRTLFSCPERHGVIRLENVAIEATTIGEAISVVERIANVRIVAHDLHKWFRVYATDDDSQNYSLVDIHVRRGDANICVKQNLRYPLLQSDTVRIGGLVC